MYDPPLNIFQQSLHARVRLDEAYPLMYSIPTYDQCLESHPEKISDDDDVKSITVHPTFPLDARTRRVVSLVGQGPGMLRVNRLCVNCRLRGDTSIFAQ